jgi:hypothetical protein
MRGIRSREIARCTLRSRCQPLGFVYPIGLAAFLALSGCGVHRQTPGEVTAAKLQQMHGALLEFRALQGHLPDSLELVCRRDSRLCELASRESWKTDGWGRAFSYVRSDEEFELHSAGADGLAGTPDDMAISSLMERSRVRAIAGCYATSRSWWKELPGNLILLDTVPRGSGYALLPDAGSYVGRWVPEGTDSVRLAWIFADQSMTLVVRHHADSLVGRALNGRSFVGVKARCSERGLE